MKNHRSVVSLPLLGLVLGTLLAASGCGKTNDLPQLQEEARATAKGFQDRFEELAHRAEAISKRGNSIRADALNSADAQRVYRQALTVIADGRTILDSAATQIKAGASDDADALPKLIDSLRERCEVALTEAGGELDAVESWIANAEQQQANRAEPAPAAPAGADPAGTYETGHAPAAGSDLPVR